VVISPSSAEVKSGDTVEFEALTTCNGEEVAGTYQWAVLSTIESTINATTGLYTAGTTDTEVTDTIQVTDTAHGNITATASVTVTQVTPPVCSITLEPSSSTVDSGATITFTATVVGEGCLAPDFDWEVETEINSQITADGASCFYEAGNNTNGILLDDTITVTDDANGTSESVTVTVLYGRITGVFPPALLSSRWIPLPYIVLVFGEDTGFNATSYPTFTPDDALTTIGQIGLGDLMGVLILLAPNAETGPVDLSVTTTNGASQEVTFTKEDAFTINLLPFMLDESENGL
jgi:plastocyanin